jgi:hypothetical protein
MGTCQRTSVRGDGFVQSCLTISRDYPAQMSSDMHATCNTYIATASLAGIAFLFALLAAFAACIAGIRRFGTVLSIIGALFALNSLVVYVAKFHYFMFNSNDHISAGWPCEIAAFLFLVIQAIRFMKVSKHGSQAILFTSQLQPQLIYGQGPYGAPQQQYAPPPAYPQAGRQYGQSINFN